MARGTSSTQTGAQAPQHLMGTQIKVSLGTEALEFLAVLGSSPKIPGSLHVFPASLGALPVPSDSQDTLASLPLAHSSCRQQDLLQPKPPSPSSSIPVSPALSPLEFCSCGSSLHPFQMCKRGLRSGIKQGQKLLSPSGIFSGKMEKSLHKPGAAESKSFC